MKVYRVENADGYGPYTAPDNIGFQTAMAVEGKLHDSSYHPLPIDGSTYPAFGFDSLEQAQHWFGYFKSVGRQWLESQGYVLAVYEVPANAVEWHPNQITFDREQATERNELPITEVF